MRHGCNGIFPFKTLTDGCKEVILIEFAHKYGISDTLYLKVSQTNMEFIGNSIKITSLQHHSWLQRESILCKHHSWLQSRNYKKNRWTSKNLDLFMNLVNQSPFRNSVFQEDIQNPNFILEYLWMDPWSFIYNKKKNFC